MKLLFLTFLVCAIFHSINCLTAEQKGRADTALAQCVAQEKTTKEAVDKAFGTTADYGKVDRNLKCYSNCFLNKTGLFVKGVVQPATIEAVLGPSYGADKIKAYMAKCNGVKGSDDCETAFMLLDCYHKQHADIM